MPHDKRGRGFISCHVLGFFPKPFKLNFRGESEVDLTKDSPLELSLNG